MSTLLREAMCAWRRVEETGIRHHLCAAGIKLYDEISVGLDA